MYKIISVIQHFDDINFVLFTFIFLNRTVHRYSIIKSRQLFLQVMIL